MYLLYLDESGTHGGSPVFVLAGLALHEQDAWHFQRRLDAVVAQNIPVGLNPAAFELHASDINSPRQAVPGIRAWTSEWHPIARDTRLRVLDRTAHAIADYMCQDAQYPFALFGAAIDRTYRDYEERGYEEVLNKFDEMLSRQATASGVHQRGIVINDKAVWERDVQERASMWRAMRGRVGQLHHLADVPFFADSRASRLIQASDYIAWALWRYYALPAADDHWVRPLWPRFDTVGGVMHGLIHVTPRFHGAGCTCPPCASRRVAAPPA